MSYRWLLFTKEKNKISKEEINGYVAKAFLGERNSELLIFCGYLSALNNIENEIKEKKKVLTSQSQDVVNAIEKGGCIPFFYYGYARALYDNDLITFDELKEMLPFTESEWKRITS